MGYFGLVRQNVQTNNFDLIKFLEASPLTPVGDNHIVSMAELNVDALRNCVIYNIYCQGWPIKTETSRKLIMYLEGDFVRITERINLQVLVHYSKLDINTKYSCADAGNLAEYFDMEIGAFLMNAATESNEILEISGEYSELVRKALITKPVLLALEICLDDILTSDIEFDGCNVEWLNKEISNMRIYVVDKFPPIKGLRGACLIDGILLCIGELNERDEVRKADLITLALHETTHYLARCKFNDFNFLSPFKYLPQSGNSRMDLYVPKKHMEIGRTLELLLFHGIQPHWSYSSEKAARHFLTALFSESTYPIISESQREELGLKARIAYTPSFGIDLIDPEPYFCC